MKQLHTSSTTVVTTPQQRKVIEKLERNHLEEGGSIFAQVYHDGLRIRVLSPAQTPEMAAALSRVLGTTATNHISNSAFARPGGDA